MRNPLPCVVERKLRPCVSISPKRLSTLGGHVAQSSAQSISTSPVMAVATATTAAEVGLLVEGAPWPSMADGGAMLPSAPTAAAWPSSRLAPPPDIGGATGAGPGDLDEGLMLLAGVPSRRDFGECGDGDFCPESWSLYTDSPSDLKLPTDVTRTMVPEAGISESLNTDASLRRSPRFESNPAAASALASSSTASSARRTSARMRRAVLSGSSKGTKTAVRSSTNPAAPPSVPSALALPTPAKSPSLPSLKSSCSRRRKATAVRCLREVTSYPALL
mmetsp:Transcript_15951/g.36037  ORF Transcript_15951/g.36037 Transcript_15951/m.36037 type:complete len:276 (-) Transcript_15951:1664-2491(-)